MSESIDTHATICPECGAPAIDGMSCRDMFGAILAWEAGDAVLAAEHFLTVAGYNLQHPAQFAEDAIAGLRAVFIERVDHGLGIAEIRRRVGRRAAGATRVLKPAAERRPRLRPWASTIADVYLHGRPAGAAARVRAWAAAIRREL